MAENEPQVQNVQPQAAKKKKGKMMLLVLVVLILLVGMALGGAKMGFISIPGLTPTKGESREAKKAEAPEAESGMGFIYSMKPFIVNLADDSGGRYLKVKFEMELNSKDLVPEVEKRMPQLTDSVIMLLSSRKYEDIVTYEGKDRMRNEIMLRLNSFLSTGSIRKIYFTEFVMQ
jgi:flagellar FliL protein